MCLYVSVTKNDMFLGAWVAGKQNIHVQLFIFQPMEAAGVMYMEYNNTLMYPL